MVMESKEAITAAMKFIRPVLKDIDHIADFELHKDDMIGKTILYKLVLDIQKAQAAAMDAWADVYVFKKPSEASSPTVEK